MAKEAPAPTGISSVITTFPVWDKVTGAEMIADDRTFNPEYHTKTAPAKKAEKKEKDKE